MRKVASKDGTVIAFDETGNGPALVLVCGGSTDRTSNAPLAGLLAKDFSVFNYDRRGRGDSMDASQYAVEREVEDIEAIVDAAGGRAFLYGISSGGALALDAASELSSKIIKLAVYEVPYFIGDKYPRPPRDTAKVYRELVAAGRRGDAVEYFMSKVVGLPAELVAQARSSPFWKGQEAIAHTLAYDATIMGDYSLPAQTIASVSVPTLVIDGSDTFPFMHDAADAIARALPHGQRRTLAGQRHDVSPDALAPVLKEFFSSP